MKTLMFKISMGYLRTGLATLGGTMVAQGYVNGNQWISVSGGIIALIMGLWSHWSKLPDATNNE